MPKQTFRYKATGVIKFSVEDLIFKTEKQARELIYDDPGGNVEWAHEKGTCEVLEVQVENLGPCDEETYRKTGEWP